MNVCEYYNSKSLICKKCPIPRIWYITFTLENRVKIATGDKEETRRVIEKVDHYKNLKPGDILRVRKNRFTKEWLMQLYVFDTWTEQLQDISYESVAKEGYLATFYNGERVIGTKAKFIFAWNKINEGRGYAWSTNPKVRAIKFKLLITKECKHDKDSKNKN